MSENNLLKQKVTKIFLVNTLLASWYAIRLGDSPRGIVRT